MIEEKFDKKDFFAWCKKHGLNKPEDIKDYFRLSGQTIRNWERHIESDMLELHVLPFWVRLSICYYDHSAGDSGQIFPTDMDEMTFTDLKLWQNKHGFKTYESTASAFNIKRQAVHLWHKRQKIPAWVALACAGYNYWIDEQSI